MILSDALWDSLCDSVTVLFCCALICDYSSFAIISMGKRELVAWLCLSTWCLMIVVWLFLTMDLSAVCDCGIS